MPRLVLIDGNSIMNRAFYGIMGNKMLMTDEGIHTNAIYGFLAIMFKILEDLNPEYLCVTFDLRAPTARHKLYSGYKANRHGMPDELAEQMPIIKEILTAMNIKIIEKEGFEADDILGTLSKIAEKQKIDVTILSGDRDTFQLASDKTTIRIPRTKNGKTESEDYDRNKVIEEYGVTPEQLIEVKGLMGDSSDNIPGVPGVGEKTALNLIKQYNSIDNIYFKLDKNEELPDLKGKLREKLEENRDLADLSKKLGTINREVPIDENFEDLKIAKWNDQEVTTLFKKLKFNRYMEKFNLKEEEKLELSDLFKKENLENIDINDLLDHINNIGEIIYYIDSKDFEDEESIINKKIKSIIIYIKEKNTVYYTSNIDFFKKYFKEIFENEKIKKIGYKQKESYILLKNIGINLDGIYYDAEIAGYILDSISSKYTLENLSQTYAKIDVNSYVEEENNDNEQINLFNMQENGGDIKNENIDVKSYLYCYCIYKIYETTIKRLNETDQLNLFFNIEMPLVEILADMQYQGIYASKDELIDYGKELKIEIEKLTTQIYNLSGGEEFNINSPKQLGNVLFEKLKLEVIKKNKSGYSTDNEVLEKLKYKHPVIEKILEYRQLVKLNSTYVEGMIGYINKKDNKIHSYFHQTVTATGRISSSEPNLQNIPTRFELGKKIRKVFKPIEGHTFIDADYSQIELRILAHMSGDKSMIEAFNNGADIHTETAAKVFDIPKEEVTKEQRSSAKAVNFGIVYGISDYGLSEQLGISRKKAKEYISQYFEKYKKIKEFMDKSTEEAKEKLYVETLFNRKRYVPELSSNNYMVRKFGERAAMNMPIQGTAADIMKIAMIKLYKKLKEEKLESKILLQIHDELLLQVKNEEVDIVKKILIDSMENAASLDVPLKVEISSGNNWYDTK